MTTKTTNEIRVFNAALDETAERGGTIVMRGVLHPQDLTKLLIDDYQREADPITSLKTLITALQSGESVPDIILGMRGERHSGRGNSYTMKDQVFIIDGQQRVNAARYVLEQNPDATIHLGATIHFNTEKEWEREQFRKLNSLRSKVSPNVLLRNMRDDSAAVLTLYGLSNAPEFALSGRVCWRQRVARGELISALTLLKVATQLHRHQGVGMRGFNMKEMVDTLDRMGSKVGIGILRENVAKFFDVIDECWGLRNIQHKELAVHTRNTFLWTVASVIADHANFWTGPGSKRMAMDLDTRRKLKQFSLADPTVMQLAGASGQAANVLYDLLKKHIDSGRRTHRLKARGDELPALPEEEEEGEDAQNGNS